MTKQPSTDTAAALDVLVMSGVRFGWPASRGEATRFTLNIDAFRMRRGEKVLLLGASGSGKSTVLGLICGIAAPEAGQIDILGTDLAGLSPARRDAFRAEHIGVVFQMFNLLPYGTIADNVALPLGFAPERQRRVAAAGGAPAETERLLGRLGLDGKALAGMPVRRLSVGQQQRVAVARALIGQPDLIIADEPTSALDKPHRAAFLDLVRAETEVAGASLLMVTHDESLSGHFDRTLALSDFVRTERRAA